METTVDPEAAIEWLERHETKFGKQETKEELQQLLDEQIHPTEKQRSTLIRAWEMKYQELLPMGVKPRTVKYDFGTVTRYGITKQAWTIPEPWRPGFWSYEEMVRITGWKG